MRIHIVLAQDAVEAYIADDALPQKAMLVAELVQTVAETNGIVVVPGLVFQTLAAQGKEERDRLLQLVSDPNGIIIVPPTQVTETLEIAEIVDTTAISPSLAHGLIIARHSGAGLATFDPPAATGTGILPPEQVFQI
jgi:hypothetical protein